MFKNVLNYFKALAVLSAVKQIFPAKHGDRRVIFYTWALEYQTPFIWRIWEAVDIEEKTERLVLEACSPYFLPPRFSKYIDGSWADDIKLKIKALYRTI